MFWLHVYNFANNVGGWIDVDGKVSSGPARYADRISGSRQRLAKIAGNYRDRGYVVNFEPVVIAAGDRLIEA
jgi:hypothetical protein